MESIQSSWNNDNEWIFQGEPLAVDFPVSPDPSGNPNPGFDQSVSYSAKDDLVNLMGKEDEEEEEEDESQKKQKKKRRRKVKKDQSDHGWVPISL